MNYCSDFWKLHKEWLDVSAKIYAFFKNEVGLGGRDLLTAQDDHCHFQAALQRLRDHANSCPQCLSNIRQLGEESRSIQGDALPIPLMEETYANHYDHQH